MFNLETLASLWTQHGDQAALPPAGFKVGKTGLEIGLHPKIMGVVNLSSQSWYRESVCLSSEAAIRRGKILAAQGADIIDVGGESTLAHADRVTETDQIRVLVPITQALAKDGIAVSIETYSSTVAEAVLDAGATLINMTGTAESEAIYALSSKTDAAVIVSYIQGTHARNVDTFDISADPFDDFKPYFEAEIEKAKALGLERLIIDPGLGFYYRNLGDGKERVRYQMETLLQTFRLFPLGKPICHALPHAFEFFEDNVRAAEPFFAILAALGKTQIYRTHEVATVRSVLNTLNGG